MGCGGGQIRRHSGPPRARGRKVVTRSSSNGDRHVVDRKEENGTSPQFGPLVNKEGAMRLRNWRGLILVTVVAGCLVLMIGSPAVAAGTTYYVNCAAATDGNGTSTSPWNNLTTVNSKTFAPGDSLLF